MSTIALTALIITGDDEKDAVIRAIIPELDASGAEWIVAHSLWDVIDQISLRTRTTGKKIGVLNINAHGNKGFVRTGADEYWTQDIEAQLTLMQTPAIMRPAFSEHAIIRFLSCKTGRGVEFLRTMSAEVLPGVRFEGAMEKQYAASGRWISGNRMSCWKGGCEELPEVPGWFRRVVSFFP
jgi:hypothetical protein